MSFRQTLASMAVIHRVSLLFLILLVFPLSLLAQPSSRGPSITPVKSLGAVEYVEVNTVGGAGQTKQLIVFVHGTPGSLSTFNRYLNDPLMRENFHMISVTRPGWLNDEDEKLPSLAVQSAALEPFLRMDRSGKGAILMAHSYGGPVIARTAMDYSELVSGLIFVAATGDPALSGPRWYNRFAVILPRFILGASLKGANAEIMPLRGQLEEMRPRWQSLTMPVLIVQGDEDRLVNPGNAQFMERMLVNADVTYLHREGLGHFVLWEEAELIRDSLLAKFQGKEQQQVEQQQVEQQQKEQLLTD